MRLMPLLKHELPAEIARWEQAGIIEAKQRDGILAFYGVEKHATQTRSLGLQVLSAIGGLFLIMAVILIIGKNWEQIPATFRISGLCLITLMLNLSGFISLRKERKSTAQLLLFLGAGMYGACIFLISQIFHLSGSLPMAFWGWAIGIIPLAFATNCLRFTLLAQALLLPYVCWYNAQEADPLLYLPLAIALWLLVIQQNSKLTFLLQLVCTLIAVNRAIPAEWMGNHLAPHTFFTIGVGLPLYFISLHFESCKKNTHQEFAILTQLWAFRLALLVLFFLTNEEIFKDFITELFDKPILVLLVGVPGLCISGTLAYVHPERWKLLARGSSIPLIACLIIPLVGVLIRTIGVDNSVLASLRLLVDLAIVTCALRFIVQGRSEMRNSYVIVGALLLSTLAILRYVDLVGDYLGTALLFSIEGALLLGLGFKLSKRSHASEVL